MLKHEPRSLDALYMVRILPSMDIMYERALPSMADFREHIPIQNNYVILTLVLKFILKRVSYSFLFI